MHMQNMSSYDKSGAMDWICKVSSVKNKFLTKHSITAPGGTPLGEDFKDMVTAHWTLETPMDRKQSEAIHRKMATQNASTDVYTIFNGSGPDHTLMVHSEDRGKRVLRTSEGLFDLGADNKAYMITPSSNVYSRTNDKFTVDKRFSRILDVKSSAENFPFAAFERGSALVMVPRAFGDRYVKVGGPNTVCMRFFKQTKRSNTMSKLVNEGMKKGNVSTANGVNGKDSEIHTRVYFSGTDGTLQLYDIPLKKLTTEGDVMNYAMATVKDHYKNSHTITRVTSTDSWPPHVPNASFMRSFDIYEEGGKFASMFICPRFKDKHCMTYVRMKGNGQRNFTEWSASASVPLGNDCLVRENISMESFANMANAAMAPIQKALKSKVVSSVTSNVYGNTLIADISMADGTVVQTAFEPVALPLMVAANKLPQDRDADDTQKRREDDKAISPFRQSI